MRIPMKAPQWEELTEEMEEIFRHPALLSTAAEPGDRYLHWDDIRHRTPPPQLTKRQWWALLKFQRLTMRKLVPLKDKDGAPFSFIMNDEMQRLVHEIDTRVGGRVPVPGPVINEETRNQVYISSLIEEAVTSSQLEGAATTRQVAKQMLRERRRPVDHSERMIWNNFETMQRISELRTAPLTPELIFELHHIITDGTLEDPSAAGRFRRKNDDVYVADGFGKVSFVPPPAETLPGRLEAMCAFANGETPAGFIHPAVRSMILHFWLAYDHPFVDGNGRTARALFYWSMLHHGFSMFEFISISTVLRKEPVKYGGAFLRTETDGGDLTYFLLYHLGVLRRAVEELERYIARKSEELRRVDLALRGSELLNHRQRALLSHALRHPGMTYSIAGHLQHHSVSYQTARTDLLDMRDRGLLEARKRGRAFLFVPVPDLEERLGRLD